MAEKQFTPGNSRPLPRPPSGMPPSLPSPWARGAGNTNPSYDFSPRPYIKQEQDVTDGEGSSGPGPQSTTGSHSYASPGTPPVRFSQEGLQQTQVHSRGEVVPTIY